MPYIKQEDREYYDNLIALFELKLVTKNDMHGEMGMLIDHIRRLSDMAQDGHMNYFITKLLIELGALKLAYFIFRDIADVLLPILLEIVTEVYQPPKYYRYNRAIGMLTCCRMEFERRYGVGAVLAYDLLNKVIKKFYTEIIGPYEDGKIDANGDVK